jgi:ComF family protein
MLLISGIVVCTNAKLKNIPTCQPEVEIMVNNWRNIIQQILFPPTCILCNAPGITDMDICQHCLLDLPTNHHCCYRCAEPFTSENISAQLCGRCLSRPPPFTETVAPFLYQHSMRYLITGLKFNKQYKNARLLAELMSQHLHNNVQKPECIMPVPLHPKRYRERGFNQSIEIAKTLAHRLSVPLDIHSATRTRNTTHQTGLAAKQRRNNMKRAFSVSKKMKWNHVAIVDDVMTTGSTVLELAATLKRAGVERVDVWVCARA